jgi:hypothetical protein
MFLGFLGIVVLGITSLVALGLLIGRLTRAARITFAAGLLATTVLGALATLSYLQRGMGFHEEGSDPTLVLTALALLLAGAGPFVAALRRSGGFGLALACAVGSLALQAGPLLGMDALGLTDAWHFLAARSLSLPSVRLGLALSLVLAVLSLLSAVVPPRWRAAALLAVALAGLGGIGGFAAGDACVTTRSTLVQGFPGGAPQRVRVEVEVLGERVSDETGFAFVPREGVELVRAVTLEQAVWVYGPLVIGAAAGVVAGAVVGLVAAWLIAKLWRRPSDDAVDAEPPADAERPRAPGPSSDQIKPA